MELDTLHGMWVDVENGAEVLTFQGEVAHMLPEVYSDGYDSDEFHTVEGVSSKRRSAQEVVIFGSCFGKRQRPSPSSSVGLRTRCGHRNVGSIFTTSCKHSTCRLCLKTYVESIVKKSLRTVDPSYDEIRVQLLCPEQRCGMELSKDDLIKLLDIETVENYEDWLRNAYRYLYRSNTTNCIKCHQGKAVKHSMMPSIDGKGKAKVNDDLSCFQSALSLGYGPCPETCICVNCESKWCAACGFVFEYQCEVSGNKGSHHCSEATNYMIINDIVEHLESIYDEYISARSKTDEQPDTDIKLDNQNGGTVKPNFHPGVHMPSSFSSSGFLDDFIDVFHVGGDHNTVWEAGTGFGGDRHEGKSTQEKVRKAEKELDSRTESVLKSLTNVLKNKCGNQFPPCLGFSAYVLLGWENVVNQLLAYFVMNDSIMDICGRGSLYIQLADLLETMAQYPELLMMLKGYSFQTVRKERSDAQGNNASDASIIRKMKNIYEQSNIFVNRFKLGKNDLNMEAELQIASCLLECYKKLTIAAEKQTSSVLSMISLPNEEDSEMTGDSEATSESDSNGDGSGSVNNNEDVLDHHKKILLYKESLRPLQFGEYPFLETGGRRHTYSKYFDGSGSNNQSIDSRGLHNKKRMVHIAKEIASLSTNLPLEWDSSIHVRVDPVRMDLLKALIVGPKGTPYQNGVFIFDIYLPPDYPQLPPKVTFLTTGCGRVRFNPNLYNDGKVCLSLLGTWSGPSWQPWKSTLLQVLVSIQSLIFVADPYYNEPGHQHFINCHGPAEEENRNHRSNTLKYAILDALRAPDPTFKDVIMTHFQHKKEEIMEQSSEWVNTCGGTTHPLYNGIVKTAEDVLVELVKVSPL